MSQPYVIPKAKSTESVSASSKPTERSSLPQSLQVLKAIKEPPKPPADARGPAPPSSLLIPREQPKQPVVVKPVFSSSYSLTPFLSGFDNTWFDAGGFGAFYSIISVDGYTQYYQGTLCSAATTLSNSSALSGSCSIVLEDGSYIWRVTGALYDYSNAVSWSFCGVSGRSSDQLSFTVVGGKCQPGSLWGISKVCAASAQSSSQVHTVTLKGSLYLGVESDLGAGVYEGKEIPRALQAALEEEFKDAHAVVSGSEVRSSVLSVDLVPEGDKKKLRHLLVVAGDGSQEGRMTGDVATVMKVTFNVHSPGWVSEQGETGDAIKSCLSRSMSSGLFVTRLSAMAKSQGLEGLRSLTHAELIDLDVLHVSASKGEQVLGATLSVLGAVCALAGLIFAALLVMYIRGKQNQSHPKRRWSRLPTDTKEVSDETSSWKYSVGKFSILEKENKNQNMLL